MAIRRTSSHPITLPFPLVDDLRFRRSVHRLRGSGWQPRGQGFESPWVHFRSQRALTSFVAVSDLDHSLLRSLRGNSIGTWFALCFSTNTPRQADDLRLDGLAGWLSVGS